MNEEMISQDEQLATANRIKEVMSNYGIKTGEVTYTIGPSVTRYKVELLDYKQLSKVKKMDSDLTLSMPCCGVRIVMPDTFKECFVYVEIPNDTPEIVSMQSVLDSPRFQEEKYMQLPVALGYTIPNDVFMFDLAEAPNLLIAGATGTGKSVTVNAIIASLLHKKKPSELKFVLVDPKIVEFAPYKPLWNSYLDVFPETDKESTIINDCDDLIVKLDALVTELENRYALFMDAGARNITMYNEMITSHRLDTDKQVMPNLRHHYLPYIVIVIDEYGDFMMQAGKQVETPIARITQKARAIGIHMILSTQRPSVNIVTGMIKANFPTRIALRTQSIIDSRTILDSKGAEQLNGRGDMLFSESYYDIIRVQGAYMSEEEVDKMVSEFINQTTIK